MQLIFEIIVQTVVQGLGTMVKKLFGGRPSASGISEIWIGASILTATLVVVIAAVR
jgi:hypothetical protein